MTAAEITVIRGGWIVGFDGENHRRFGHAEAEAVHLFSCPLAFGKSGATWLQRGKPARNPYLGQESSCGELQEALGGGITALVLGNSQGGTR